MEQNTVYLEEKWVAGICKRTKNDAPDMVEIVNGMWQELYQKGIMSQIEGKVSDTAIALYDNYESDVNGFYDVTIGVEVSKTEQEMKNLTVKKLPAGRYAKFHGEGLMQDTVCKLWHQIWQLDLKRSYQGDFEEYVACDGIHCSVNIYIGLA